MFVFCRPLTFAVVVAMLVSSCSSSDEAEPTDGTGPATSSAPASDAPAGAFAPTVPTEVFVPEHEGNGMLLPQPASPLPDGYVMAEHLVGGTAASFTVVEQPADGRWVVEPGDEARYRTRVIVRRPERTEDFSGTVVVEWFNISALEAAPEWAYLADEIAREGHAYVGVSAQAQGVEGGATVLAVDVDDEIGEAGADADVGGLKHTDPDRYGSLSHPGDAWSFDIFSQVGRLVATDPGAVLGDLVPDRVIAAGESQSAAFVTTLVNAVHPLAPVFDGFLVHSRPAVAAPLDGDYARAREAVGAAEPGEGVAGAVVVRDDVDVPVLLFVTETDLTRLRYAQVRQADTTRVRTWEVAGTAHADAQLLRAVVGGPRDPAIGDLLGCGPINTGPQKEVLSAAFHHLVSWVGGGDPPPTGERIAMTDDDMVIVRDALGIAVGGVRNPLVDVPVFVPSGERDPTTGGGTSAAASDAGSAAASDVCALMGTTVELDALALGERHGSADEYVEAFVASANALVDAGFLLAPDAASLVAEAEEQRTRF